MPIPRPPTYPARLRRGAAGRRRDVTTPRRAVRYRDVSVTAVLLGLANKARPAPAAGTSTKPASDRPCGRRIMLWVHSAVAIAELARRDGSPDEQPLAEARRPRPARAPTSSSGWRIAACFTRKTERTGTRSSSAISSARDASKLRQESCAISATSAWNEESKPYRPRETRRGSAPPSPCRRHGSRRTAGCGVGRAEQPFDGGHRRDPRCRCRRHAAPPQHCADIVLHAAFELAKVWRPLAVSASRYRRWSDVTGLRVINPSSSNFWTMRLR